MKKIITAVSVMLFACQVFAGGADDFITCQSLNSDQMSGDKVDYLLVSTRHLETEEIGEAGSDFRLTFYFNGTLVGTGDYTEPEAKNNSVLNGYTQSNGKEELNVSIDLPNSRVQIGGVTLNSLSCERP